MFGTKYDIFLTYSHHDQAPVLELARAFRRLGYRTFLDNASIPVGERWKLRIEKDLRASRVCILCWSEKASHSEFVAFEYACAMGLGRPVLPWLLDATKLPEMVEIHGVEELDPEEAVRKFRSRLGWPLRTRLLASSMLLLLTLAAAGFAYWRTHLPPPPWEFTGRVTDSVTGFPIAGVEVEAEERKFTAITAADGAYLLHLPSPKPKYVDLVFLRNGYRGEFSGPVHTDRPFNTDMVPLK
jgi:TIR domain